MTVECLPVRRSSSTISRMKSSWRVGDSVVDMKTRSVHGLSAAAGNQIVIGDSGVAEAAGHNRARRCGIHELNEIRIRKLRHARVVVDVREKVCGPERRDQLDLLCTREVADQPKETLVQR